MMKKLHKKDVGLIVEKILQGKTSSEIAPHFGVSSDGLRCFMSRHQIKGARAYRRRYGVRVKYKEHFTLQALALANGLTPVRVLEMLLYESLKDKAFIARRVLSLKSPSDAAGGV